MLLGVGAGWQVNEHEQYGIDLPRPGELLARFEEACQVWHGLLREPTTTIDGRYYQLTDAICEPKPVQDPLPLLDRRQGRPDARHRRPLRRRVEHVGPRRHHRRASRRPRPALRAHRPRPGRDQALRPGPRSCVTDDEAKAKAFREDTGRPAVAGTADDIAEAVAEWQAIGLDEVIVPDFTLGKGQNRLDRLDLIIEQVAPQFR